jgi:hypothetical protein
MNKFALKLYKFIKDNNIEHRYEMNNGYEDVIIFVNKYLIEEFMDIIGDTVGDWDDPYVAYVKDGYFAFWMGRLLEYNDIEFVDIFEK